MRLSLLLKMEFRRFIKMKIVIIFLLSEIFGIVIAYFSTNDFVNQFSIDGIYLSNYFSIILILRYLYSAVLISYLFSKDIKTGVYKTYIASGVPRVKVWISKVFCCISLLIINILIGSCLYIICSVIEGNAIDTVVEFFISIILSFIPLFIFMLLLILIDVYFLSASVTIFVSTFIIIFIPFIPYDVAKWIFISYNNPMLVLTTQTIAEIIKMVIVFSITLGLIIFLELFYMKNVELE